MWDSGGTTVVEGEKVPFGRNGYQDYLYHKELLLKIIKEKTLSAFL